LRTISCLKSSWAVNPSGSEHRLQAGHCSVSGQYGKPPIRVVARSTEVARANTKAMQCLPSLKYGLTASAFVLSHSLRSRKSFSDTMKRPADIELTRIEIHN
jgi:hypothetical protein